MNEEKVYIVKELWNDDGEYYAGVRAHRTLNGALNDAKDTWNNVLTRGHFEGVTPTEDGDDDGNVAEVSEDGTHYLIYCTYDDYSVEIWVEESYLMD